MPKDKVEKIIAGIEKKAQEAKAEGDMETYYDKTKALKEIYIAAKAALLRNDITPM